MAPAHCGGSAGRRLRSLRHRPSRDCGPLPAAGSPYRIEVADQNQDDTGTYQVTFQRLTLSCAATTVVTIVASDPTATEAGATTGAFTVTRTGATTAALTVNYTVAGTATAGSDYVTLSGSVTIPAGSASALIVVTPIDDTVVGEGNETVVVTVDAGTGYTIGTPSSDTVTIVDNDPVVVTIAATDPTASETGPDTGTFTVSPHRPHDRGAHRQLHGHGFRDAQQSTTSRSAAPSSSRPAPPPRSSSSRRSTTPSSARAMRPSSSPWPPEPATPSAVPSSDTVTIVDNDPVVVTIVATDPTASETGPNTGTFTVTRTGPTGSALTVDCTVAGTATAGSDYVALSGSVTIPAGSASASSS